MIPLLLAATLELVAAGAARVHVETDDAPAARYAAEVLKRNVVLMTGVALPDRGPGPALRFEGEGADPGYRITIGETGAVVRGADPVRAAYDLLEGWGCRFDGNPPEVPQVAALAVAERTWRPERTLYVEDEEWNPALPAHGVAVRGLSHYRPEGFTRMREVGYELRVASTTFDDFLPPELFAGHREWFARRGEQREARGNFALRNPEARAAYLDRLGAWLAAHPEVDCAGIWPEVTTVWDEEALDQGAEESYALLWREAAERFPGRRFEILATGLTLKPPQGRVPANVEVRLRPGPDASALQAIPGQEIEAVVDAWEVRGARVVLEIDAAPESWCGMPWPCHDAIRGNARRFHAAVLRGGGPVHARLWRDPAARVPLPEPMEALLARARTVRSWGHPRDAAELFLHEEEGMPFRIGAVERLLRVALDGARDAEERRSAARDAYLGYRAILRDLDPAAAEPYRRYRARDFRRAIEELLPGGVEHEVGPAQVREGFDRVEVETGQLRLAVDRRTGAVVSLQRRLGKEWSADLTGGDGTYFAVVALREETARTDGEVRVTSPETGRVRLELGGLLRPGGPRWSSTLEWSGAAGLVRQTARVGVPGGIAAGCRWKGAGIYDHWVCPPHAAEGPVGEGAAGLYLPAGTLLYCRQGERGPGLAVRPAQTAVVSVTAGASPTLVVARPAASEITVDWIVFTDLGELGK